MADIRAPLPFSTKPWETAKRRFLDGLAPEQRTLFTEAKLDNLFYTANATYNQHAEDSKLRKIQQKLQPLISSVEEYGRAIDVFAQMSTLVLSPIWGCIRVALHISQQYAKYHDRLVEMYARISDNLPRFQIYEQLFSRHERLIASIADAYLDIIYFSVEAVEIFGQARKGSSLSRKSLVKRAWKLFEDRFQEYISNFRRHQESVAEEARLAHYIEEEKARELELASRALEEQKAEMKRRKRILTLFSTLDYRAKHLKVQEQRYPGTGTWLAEDPRFRTWLDAPDSDCFLCFGIPGSGKTVLASAVIETVFPLFADEKSASCYHYCDYADSNSLEPRTIVGSLIRQLLERMRIPTSISDLCLNNLNNGYLLSLADMETAFLDAIRGLDRVFIIVDGIDEIPKCSLQKTIDFLLSLSRKCTQSIKLMILGRRQELTQHEGFKKYEAIEICHQINRKDISEYVNATVEEKIKRKELVVSEDLKQIIISRLINEANDMFLWVRFQIDEICEALTEDQIRHTLDNLPRDLAETYRRILGKVAQSQGGDQKIVLATKLFKWITCARRLLTVEELKEAIAVDEGDTKLERSKIPGDGFRMLQCCANLIVVDLKDKTVRLAHHTVKQFLTSAVCLDSSPLFSLSDAEFEIGRLCVTYLRYSDFEMQLTQPQTPVTTSVPIQALRNVITYNVPFSASIVGAMSWLRGGSAASTKDQLINLRIPQDMDKSEELEKQYMLLNYISTNWPWHSHGYNTSDDFFNQLFELALHRPFAFNIRPWIDARQNDDTPPGLPLLGLFRWAIDHDLPAFLHIISRYNGSDLDRYSLYESKKAGERLHPMLRACRSTSSRILADLGKSFALTEPLTLPVASELVSHLTSQKELTLLQHVLDTCRLESDGTLYDVAESILSAEAADGNTAVVERIMECGVKKGYCNEVITLRYAVLSGNLETIKSVLRYLEASTIKAAIESSTISIETLCLIRKHGEYFEHLCCEMIDYIMDSWELEELKTVIYDLKSQYGCSWEIHFTDKQYYRTWNKAINSSDLEFLEFLSRNTTYAHKGGGHDTRIRTVFKLLSRDGTDRGREIITVLLKQPGIHIDPPKKGKRNPFSCFLILRDSEVISSFGQIYLERGLRDDCRYFLQEKDQFDQTPLEAAVRYGDSATFTALSHLAKSVGVTLDHFRWRYVALYAALSNNWAYLNAVLAEYPSYSLGGFDEASLLKRKFSNGGCESVANYLRREIID